MKQKISYKFRKAWSALHWRIKNRKAYSHVRCEWASFEEFERDMRSSFDAHIKKHGSHETTLDRIKNEGNYSKENCRWATRKQQFLNQRHCNGFTYKNRKFRNRSWLYRQYVVLEKSMKRIAREQGCDYTAIRRYLKKLQIPLRSREETYVLRNLTHYHPRKDAFDATRSAQGKG